MDAKFDAAVAAIEAGDAARFGELIRREPTLATSRSSTSHPTLLQCLVLSAKDSPAQLEMAQALIAAGAPLDEPLVACASCDNVEAAGLLLDAGAAINGTGSWSPLEEALYWHSVGMVDLLLRRGATVHNLRIAAGLGRTDLVEAFFNADGSLKPEAGRISWPFGDLSAIEQSNHAAEGKRELAARVRSWAQDRQGIVDNAFVYACMHGHIDAARLLLEKGARINAIPGGFDYAGTGLHYAALNGHRPMVEYLLQNGAIRRFRTPKSARQPPGGRITAAIPRSETCWPVHARIAWASERHE